MRRRRVPSQEAQVREPERKARALEKEPVKEELEPAARASAEAQARDLAQVLVEVDLAELQAAWERAAQAPALEEAPEEAAMAREPEAARELARAQALGLEPAAPEQEVAEVWDSDLALAAAREWDPAGPWAVAPAQAREAEPGQATVRGADRDLDSAPAAGLAAARAKGAAWVNRRTKTSTRSSTR